ncbi:conserved hypothetical protein [Talaromyces stipitatus ATCC 10500]|uniref:Uncharacterized protein n=1 Tax=Talaromyces stipitatus (strain ATCC 10500 / CBS 375.48 / QM 6759 / NRRL 1006) TaxID=441959 RepID=B8M0I9_TALSN|nr:uncharacterized protein TSTA_085170 [Talaromyces stipitatus ATCC 10500]EED21286.1 conserved hypothetical protein [Talaromyces stipitatus ATCC 10500]
MPQHPQHGSQVARERLNIIWEKLVCGVATERSRTDGHVEFINDFQIDHHPGFDFEALNKSGYSIETRSRALIWFKPLPEDMLERYPCKGLTKEFDDYDSTQNDGKLRNEDRTRAVHDYVEECSRLRMGRSLSTLGAERSLMDYLKIHIVESPSPYLVGPGLDGSYPQLVDYWRVGNIYETMTDTNTVQSYPLLTLQAWHTLNGKEDMILLGELYTLICAMRNRVNQRRADDPDERKALWDFPADVEYCGFQFESEIHFPVVFLSYVGPQHGRIFYAYMDRYRLVICQSKLYSFEKKESAPVDFFTRMLLSRPLQY